jgi:hypothetical protein
VEQAVVRVAAVADSRDALERFARELMPLITAGPPGTTGYAAGRPRAHPLFRYWPCLIDRHSVEPQIGFVTSSAAVVGATGSASENQQWPAFTGSALAEPVAPNPVAPPAPGRCFLSDIAIARSGDKGTSANVGVIARDAEDYAFLNEWLTTDRVAEFFRPLGATSVTRYELPNLGALNFILHGILSDNLRTDAQGKALGQMMLAIPLT